MLSKLKLYLEHAFKIDDGSASITEEEKALIEKLSKFVVKKHMSIPAVMFLESVKPLNYVGSSILTFFKPTMGAILSKFEYENLRVLLEKRCSIELLIKSIENNENSFVKEKANV